MRDLERQAGQREARIPGAGAHPDHRLPFVRTVGVAPETGLSPRALGARDAQGPKPDVVAFTRAVIDRFLKADVLAAPEQIQRREGRGRIRLVENESPYHAP